MADAVLLFLTNPLFVFRLVTDYCIYVYIKFIFRLFNINTYIYIVCIFVYCFLVMNQFH